MSISHLVLRDPIEAFSAGRGYCSLGGKPTFWMGSTTVARLLERKVGEIFGEKGFVRTLRDSCLEDKHLCMMTALARISSQEVTLVRNCEKLTTGATFCKRLMLSVYFPCSAAAFRGCHHPRFQAEICLHGGARDRLPNAIYRNPIYCKAGMSIIHCGQSKIA